MEKLVTLTIEGVQVEVPEGTLVVDAARKAGVDIPVFCYHPKMEPVGMCRMCLVEIGRPVIDRTTGQPILEADRQSPDTLKPKIQFGAKLETACTTPVSEGMVVLGITEKARAGRRDNLEFLLTSHPLDCPICDKGGECPLQDLTMRYGPEQSRFLYDEKKHLGKQIPLGELIFLDRERCIQCGRCVRFQEIVVDDPVIGFTNRGCSMEIISYSEPGFDSIWSGNTTDICPVGALTTSEFRFRSRPWELNAAASICNHCPVGCNLVFNVRREVFSPAVYFRSNDHSQSSGYSRFAGSALSIEYPQSIGSFKTDEESQSIENSQPTEYSQSTEYTQSGDWVIKRVMPRQNEAVNEIWICDKGRFGYHFARKGAERLTSPLIRKGGVLEAVSWNEALSVVAERLGDSAGGLLTLAGGRLTNEDLYNLRKLTSALNGKTVIYTHMAGGELTTQFGFTPGTNMADLGKGSAILVVGSDLEEEAPLWWLRARQAARRGAALIVLNPRVTRLDRSATFSIHYPFGSGAAAVLAMINAIMSLNRTAARLPELPTSIRGFASSADLLEAAKVFSEASDAIVLFGSESMGLIESGALAQVCAHLLQVTGHLKRPNNGLLGVWPRANDQGAWELGWRPALDLQASLMESKALYIVATDPVSDDSAYLKAFGGQKFVIVQDLFLSQTARLADVVLPVQSWVEREGSFTSGERRVQRFFPVVRPYTASLRRIESPGTRRAQVLTGLYPPLQGPLADFTIPALIAQRLEIEGLTGANAATVFARLSAEVQTFSGLDYQKLSQVHDQWPMVGKRDLYYCGTVYDNVQGLGTQLPLANHENEAGEGQEGFSWPQGTDFKLPKLGLMAFPVTRLYDRGATIMPSRMLHRRIGEPYIILNAHDGKRLKLESGSMIRAIFSALGQSVVVQALLDDTLPERVVLVPRSFGVPVSNPTPVEVRPV